MKHRYHDLMIAYAADVNTLIETLDSDGDWVLNGGTPDWNSGEYRLRPPKPHIHAGLMRLQAMDASVVFETVDNNGNWIESTQQLLDYRTYRVKPPFDKGDVVEYRWGTDHIALTVVVLDVDGVNFTGTIIRSTTNTFPLGEVKSDFLTNNFIKTTLE